MWNIIMYTVRLPATFRGLRFVFIFYNTYVKCKIRFAAGHSESKTLLYNISNASV